MADHPWTCRERCFYCGMTRNKTLALCTYLALCQTRLNDNIFTYQYFLITIKFNILEWRGNYKSHEIRIWKNEGKKLSRNLYRFTVLFKQNKNYLWRTIWQHLQVLQNKFLTVGDWAGGRDRGSRLIVREICFHGFQPEKCGSNSVWRQCWY